MIIKLQAGGGELRGHQIGLGANHFRYAIVRPRLLAQTAKRQIAYPGHGREDDDGRGEKERT